MKRHNVGRCPGRGSASFITAVLVAVLAGLGWFMIEPSRQKTALAAAPIQPVPVARIRRHRISRPESAPPASSTIQPVDATAAPLLADTTATPDAVQTSTADGDTTSDSVDTNRRTGFVWNGGNLRAGPGLTHRVVGGVVAGDVVDLMRKENSWWQVKTPDAEGWLSDTLLVVDGETNSLAPSNGGLATSAGGAAEKPSRRAAQPPATVAPTAPKAPSPANVASLQPDPTATQRAAKRPALATGSSLWSVTIVPGEIVALPAVAAPHPFLAPAAVGPFLRARTRVYLASGVDYLGQLDEAFRSVDFASNKPGVARLSWHKAGRAIDVSRSRVVNGVQGVVFVRDTASLGLSRVLIRCTRQGGSLGSYFSRAALAYGGTAGYYVDVTSILASEGFQRIPHNGDVSEIWHYELRAGLTWTQAMQQLYTVRTLRHVYPEVWR